MVVVKAYLEGEQWVLDVLGNPYGGHNKGKDAHDEFFSPRTNFREEYHGLPPAVYYHGYDPKSGKPMGAPEYVGRSVKRWVDAAGVWYKVVLDQASAYARRIWDAAQQLKAVASTGSADHLWRVNKRTGEIEHWPVVELSLWDLQPNSSALPANWYAVAIPAIKALYSLAGMDAPAEFIDDGNDGGGKPRDHKEHHTMEPDEIQAFIDKQVAEALAHRDAATALAAQRQADEEARIATAVESALKMDRERRAADRRLPDVGIDDDLYMSGQAPHQAKFADVQRYDGLSLEDQVFLIGLVNSKPGMHASQSAYKAAYIKAYEAKDSAPAWEMRTGAMKAGFDLGDAAHATKANELMHSTQTGYGDEWIGIGYSSQLWLAVRDPTRIAGMLPEIIIPQGSESVYDPLEGADPTFYKVPETTATNATTGRPDATIGASKAGTDRVLHTATKIGGRIVYSGEMDENSLVATAPQLRTQLETAAGENLDHVIVDGDTDATASTNINNIAGTPAATDVFLSFNGFRKLCLITNTANARDGGTLTDDDFLETAKLMGTAGLLGADVRKTIFLIDANVRWKILTIASVKTRDVFLSATIENGELTGIYGYKIHASYQMHKQSAKRMANTAGKIHATDSNNTTGSILGVRIDQWKLARKRRVMFETSRYPEADANQIVVTFSAGLKPRDNEAAAISYDLTI